MLSRYCMLGACMADWLLVGGAQTWHVQHVRLHEEETSVNSDQHDFFFSPAIPDDKHRHPVGCNIFLRTRYVQLTSISNHLEQKQKRGVEKSEVHLSSRLDAEQEQIRTKTCGKNQRSRQIITQLSLSGGQVRGRGAPDSDNHTLKNSNGKYVTTQSISPSPS